MWFEYDIGCELFCTIPQFEELSLSPPIWVLGDIKESLSLSLPAVDKESKLLGPFDRDEGGREGREKGRLHRSIGFGPVPKAAIPFSFLKFALFLLPFIAAYECPRGGRE